MVKHQTVKFRNLKPQALTTKCNSGATKLGSDGF